MKNLIRIGISLIIIGIVTVGAFFAYIWFTGGSGEVSEDIADAAETIDDAGSGILFRIDSEDSQATFSLDELLMGNPTTVVGRTTQVGGDFVIDFNNPSASTIGTIRINSRSFATDQEMRNRAIRNNILQSAQDEFEFIDFVPTALDNLPETITIDETYAFDIVGDLTIIGMANPVTFATEVTIESENAISGVARANVTYADWGITIPDATGVANVSDTVDLEIAFEADAVEEDTASEE